MRTLLAASIVLVSSGCATDSNDSMAAPPADSEPLDTIDPTDIVDTSAPLDTTPGVGDAADAEPEDGGADAPEPASPCSFPETVGTDYQLTRVFPNVGLNEPMGLVRAPDSPDWWYVPGRLGQIWRFPNEADTDLLETVLDISAVVDPGGDSGLLSMAFDPDFATNGYLYVSYTRVGGTVMLSRLSRFHSVDGGQSFDPESETVLLEIDQDDSQRFHSNCRIAFGVDGYLYAAFGDGGPDSDPDGHAQDPHTLRGTFVRIDVSTEPWSVPPDNPFVGGGGRPEVWAYGFRNPWQWHQDPETGLIWAGDVGENIREEYGPIQKGGNHGWPQLEGTWCHAEPCVDGTVEPLVEYDHHEGHSITGGPIYRGTAMPELVGKGLVGDFINGFIWSVDTTTGDRRLVVDSDVWITAFAVHEGEVYAIDVVTAALYKLEPGATDRRMPLSLTDTGCVDVADPKQAADHLTPYQVASELYSDGAGKARWLSLPADAAPSWVGDRLDLPVGSVLVKSFDRDGVRMETRLLARHENGWHGYTYDWTPDQTAAVLRDPATRGTPSTANDSWIVPTRKQCRQCHTPASGGALGMSAWQLSELDRTNLEAPPTDLPGPMPSPTDPSAPLEQRARAYLHANCAHCHQPNTWAFTPLNLRYDTAFEQTGLCEMGWAFGGPLIDTADPWASGIVTLMGVPNPFDRMPPFGVDIPDQAAMEMLVEWIGEQVCP